MGIKYAVWECGEVVLGGKRLFMASGRVVELRVFFSCGYWLCFKHAFHRGMGQGDDGRVRTPEVRLQPRRAEPYVDE